MERLDSVSILWGSRREDIKDLTKNILESLNYLDEVQPEIFSKWYKLGNSREDALSEPVELNSSSIKTYLESNFDEKYPKLGILISQWNGAQNFENQASILARLNCTSNRIKNNFILNFPAQNNFKTEEVDELISRFVQIFDGEQVRINGEIVDKI